MIRRYWRDEMRAIWETSEQKFAYWLETELAVLTAREELKQIPPGTAKKIKARVWMDEEVATAIERRDQVIKHDLNAFIEIISLQIITASREAFNRVISQRDESLFNEYIARGLGAQEASELASYFHDGMTSYDTEEPAMSMLLRDSCLIIEESLHDFAEVLTKQANRYRGTPMIGRTHGQHAQPITFAVKLLGYREMVARAESAMFQTRLENAVMKLSGAVGMYGTLGPEVEKRVGEILCLKPVMATQILPLDRRARLVNELAVTASVLEKIANDLWLMSQTEIGEIREPFSKEQKGSSAMPHKKNPIGLENIMGVASVVRSCAITSMANIVTAHERDIAHSSAERVDLVDAFGMLDHMLARLARIVSNMSVFPEQMKHNLSLTNGVYASQRFEMWLKRNGMPAETAYRTVQEACHRAMESKVYLPQVLMNYDVVREYRGQDSAGFHACSDLEAWLKEEDGIFNREIGRE